jgi:hypothetical protein
MGNAGKGGRRGTNGAVFFPGGKAQPTGTVSTQAVPDVDNAVTIDLDQMLVWRGRSMSVMEGPNGERHAGSSMTAPIPWREAVQFDDGTWWATDENSHGFAINRDDIPEWALGVMSTQVAEQLASGGDGCSTAAEPSSVADDAREDDSRLGERSRWLQETRETMLAQIGDGNVYAISGGQFEGETVGDDPAIRLPVAHGYSVRVVYNQGSDTYTVQRLYTRLGKTTVKGEVADVYCDQLGKTAYRASCYASYDANQWVK